MKIQSGFTAFCLLIASLTFVSCTAKIYVQDRHTIMEDEAAGEWPQFEKDLLNKSGQSAPTSYSRVDSSAKEQRLYNVLNGEMISSNAAGK